MEGLELVQQELKSLRENTANQIQKAVEGKASAETIEALKAEHKEGFDKMEGNVKAMQEQLDQIATDQKKGLSQRQEQKSFSDLVDDQLKANADQLKALKGMKGGGGVAFDVKAVGTQLLANYNSGTGIALTTWDNEMARTPNVNPYLRQLVRTRPINSLMVAWAEHTGGEGGAGTVLEGAKKPQVDFDFIEASKKVEKIAVFTKASKEALDDIAFLRAEINSELVDKVELKLDEQILTGDGTTPNLKGINTYASALSVTGLPFATANGGILSPNRADALLVAAAVIANNGFIPNIAVINPLDAAMMQLTKDANGNYILPPFSTSNGLQIAGLRVVANRSVVVGNFTVGDFSKDTLGIREEINIQIGYENDDFTKNLITILAEMRAVNYIKAQHVPAFTKGSFATVMAAIAEAAV